MEKRTVSANKFVVEAAKWLVGLLFIFSGLIKANDPLGFSYKLQEYFEVFHLLFLNDFATAIAISLCALEIILGAALILGIKGIKVAWGLLLLIIFFTFLTFYSAAFDVVRTCGCFGDAIPLTPWQSFSKDLVLLVLIIVLFVNRKRIQPVITSAKAQQIVLLLIIMIGFGVGIYTYNYLPVMDFLPYKIGANLPEEMKIPPGAPLDEYEITYNLVNKKTGEKKIMTDKEYLKTEIWKDENWLITGEPKSRLVKEGYHAKISDLKITDAQGTDYTSELLENPYYNLVIVAYDLKATDIHAIGDMNALAINAAENYNIRTVLLTSASAQDAQAFARQNKLMMEIFYADAVPLKSMVRANPGLLLLKNGVVINKWHYHTLPGYQELENKYFQHY
ncbi:DoxX family protein [Pedobacter sp. BS3]|uniref:BT_3928 family protein n=1 Tax=Pedobacter sp. BS3 TaxID=2567937 RepID=UPI0011EC6A43|nr:BT_3928 family protein [Pedobacter sp. BS3]TZF81692.1 DoxX family protein [Pedobacter sp. BS3]